MGTSRFLTAITIFILLGITPVTPSFAGDKDDPVDIFNGKDLNGWVVDGGQTYKEGKQEKPVWSAKDGMIVSTGAKFGFLRYDKELKDFSVHAEYRMSKGCNSGFGIRTVKFTGTARTRPSYAAYEIQVLDDAGKTPGTHSSGALYRYVAPKLNATKPAGQWNSIDIECRGSKIRVVLNGRVIQDIDQTGIEALKDKPLTGYFCLQSHTKRIEFRNLRLKEL